MHTSRRSFFKNLAMSGLAFSGIQGLACSDDEKQSTQVEH